VAYRRIASTSQQQGYEAVAMYSRLREGTCSTELLFTHYCSRYDTTHCCDCMPSSPESGRLVDDRIDWVASVRNCRGLPRCVFCYGSTP
jgi:hypothetical protein